MATAEESLFTNVEAFMWLLVKKLHKERESRNVYLCQLMYEHAAVRSMRERKNLSLLMITKGHFMDITGIQDSLV